MGRNSIQILIILAVVSIVGMLVTQVIFLKSTSDINYKQLHVATVMALHDVVDEILEHNDSLGLQITNPLENPEVKIIGNDMYFVNVGTKINCAFLEEKLVQEFIKLEVFQDFEFQIYNASRDNIAHKICYWIAQDSIYSDGVDGHNCRALYANKDINNKNYFIVMFPGRAEDISDKMNIWYLADFFMIIIMIFFCYSLYVIIKQRELSQIQKNFVNNLTHEFKTPISAISLSAKVLEDSKVFNQPQRAKQYIAIISEQTQRLSLHVEHILQVAMIDKNIKLSREYVNLNEYILEVVKDFKKSQLPDSFIVNFESNKENIYLEIDKLHFSNVIYNLLDNAIKYSDEKPNINISIIAKNKQIQMLFADNGIGISQQYYKKIFNRFYRIPTGDVHNVKGFGLGLDYVRKMIKLHGFNIGIKQNEPRGTIFIITVNGYDRS